MLVRPSIDASIPLSDGREVAYADFGPDGGKPLVYFHGHPGCRLDLGRKDLLGALQEAGFRLIGFDRPGFGGTRFIPGRSHLDWARDIERAADHLGLERFSVLGYSGGGLFALACAIRTPDRLDGVCLLSAGATREMPSYQQAWRRDVRALMSVSRRTPGLSGALTKANMRLMQRSERAATKGLSRFLRSAADDDVIAAVARENPGLLLSLTRECNRQGAAALIEDFSRLFDWPLDFSLADVGAHVALWHGNADNLGAALPRPFHGRAAAQRPARGDPGTRASPHSIGSRRGRGLPELESPGALTAAHDAPSATIESLHPRSKRRRRIVASDTRVKGGASLHL